MLQDRRKAEHNGMPLGQVSILTSKRKLYPKALGWNLYPPLPKRIAPKPKSPNICVNNMSQSFENGLDQIQVIIKGLYMASLCGGILVLLTIPWLFLRTECYALHNSIIPLEESTYNALMFLLFGIFKMFIMVFLLLPAIGLHIALAQYQKSHW